MNNLDMFKELKFSRLSTFLVNKIFFYRITFTHHEKNLWSWSKSWPSYLILRLIFTCVFA